MLENLLQDLRFGLRTLAKSPGVTLAAILALALGIGANTAVFSLVNAVLLRPLPAENPDELARLYTSHPRSSTPFGAMSYPDYADFHQQTSSFAGIAAYSSISVSLTRGQQTDFLAGTIVSGNYFDVLGVKPALGRAFLPEEDSTPLTHPVAVIGYGLWQRTFGGDPGIVNRDITLNGQLFRVVGVAPEKFGTLTRAAENDVWIPLAMQQVVRPPSAGLRRALGSADLLDARGPTWLNVIGRLKPGVAPGPALEQARADAAVVAKRLEVAYPGSNRDRSAIVIPADDAPGLRDLVLPVFAVLMCVVGLVLLIACANVANLLLARATGRRREIAVRLALGASRGRLVRQLLTEAVVLALSGGGVGILLAAWTKDLFYLLEVPRTFEIGLDPNVLAYSFALAVGAGLIFGLAPALQSTRRDLVVSLKDEAGQVAGGSHRSRLRSALVVTQVALSLVLLVGAGLFLRTLREARAASPGFDPENVLAVQVNLDTAGYNEAQGRDFIERLTERLEAMPGAVDVTTARISPLSGSSRTYSIQIEGRERPADAEPLVVPVNVVGLNYFPTVRQPILRGRDFTAQDNAAAPPVAIVSQAMARQHWPGEDAVGKRFRVNVSESMVEVVGVAGDAKNLSLRQESDAFFYLPMLQNYESVVNFHIRARGEPAALVDSVRAQVFALNPHMPLFDTRTLEGNRQETLTAERITGSLLTVFGALALVLAAVGLFGVMAYSVAQRTHEIGIRMALGARTADIFGLVVREGMRQTAMGVVVGLAAAVGLTQLVKSMLFGVSPLDPLTYIAVPVLLAVVALLACWVPARRATRVDPIVALRYE